MKRSSKESGKQSRDQLPHKHERAIAALLSEDTLAAVAAHVGISVPTLWRWMQQPEFQIEYRRARSRVVERAIGAIQSATDDAVLCLRRNLTCDQPSVQVRAAQIILEMAIKGVEVVDLQERIERLEELEAPSNAPHDRKSLMRREEK